MSDTVLVSGDTPTPAAIAPTPVATPVAPSSSLQQPTGPRTVASVTARIQDALKFVPPAPPAEVAKPTAPAPETVAPEGTAPEAEVIPETPAEEPEATPEAEPEAADPEESEDGEGQIKIPTAKQLRINVPETDQVGRLASALMRRNKDWGMEEALNAAKKQLGIKPAATEAAPEAAAPKSDLPDTIEAVDATLDSLEAEREKFMVAVDFENAAKLDRQIRKLDRHRATLERQGQQKQVEQAQAYEAQFSQAENKAKELYDFVNKPDTPAWKRALEIENDMKETGDPTFYSPDKVLRISQMVASEMSIAPRRKGAPAVPAKAAAPAPTAPKQKQQVLPNGGSTTVKPVANSLSPLDTRIRQAPKTMEGLRKLYKEMGIH